MGCPNKVIHVTYGAVSCKAWRSIVSQTSGLMKENGKGGKGQESSGLVGRGFVVIVQASYE